jgi:hypothetical protein
MLLALASVLAYVAAPARDREFQAIVHHLDAHYHVRRAGLPYLGLFNLSAGLLRPAGLRGIRMALFAAPEGARRPDLSQFAEIIGGELGPDWRPLVRIQSRRSGEARFVYARDASGGMQMIVVQIKPEEAVVLQVNLDAQSLVRYVASPHPVAEAPVE